MTTFCFTHGECLDHQPGPHHPERPERLTAILTRLQAADFVNLIWRDAPYASAEQIQRVHPEAHLDAMREAMPEHDRRAFDADTAASPGTWHAILRAAGAGIAAVDAVMTGQATNAFCAVRPPGHHAEAAQVMGFCFVNNIAVAARHAQAVHGCRHVAIIDFDVHHGNGTQAIFEHDRTVFYGSTHQSPLYPGTGSRNETGVGNVVNAPLGAGTGSAEFRHAMRERILPALSAFAPDFVLISAGFDGHAEDPLASLRLHEEDFAWATTEIRRIARHDAEDRIVSMLEGGYALTPLAESVAAHVRALMAA